MIVLCSCRFVVVSLEKRNSPPLDPPQVILVLDKVFSFGMFLIVGT